jgi:hypothetical protein
MGAAVPFAAVTGAAFGLITGGGGNGFGGTVAARSLSNCLRSLNGEEKPGFPAPGSASAFNEGLNFLAIC